MVTDVAQLQLRIAEMGSRIGQLEDALAILQSGISGEPHPLLRDEFLGIKFAPEKCCATDKEELRKDTTDMIEALGMLTIGEQGAKYYGPSAGPEVRRYRLMMPICLICISLGAVYGMCSYSYYQMKLPHAFGQAGAEMDMTAVENDKASRVSTQITGLSRFPFGTGQPTGVSLGLVSSHLPPQQRAWALYEAYMEHAACMFRPLKRDEMIDEILSPVYKAMKDKQSSGSHPIESISPHKLAILFLVFALGALVDLTLEPCKHFYYPSLCHCIFTVSFLPLDSTESETYYHLSCACLSLRSVFDSPETATVQALVLMAAFHAEGGRDYTTDSAVSIQAIGMGLYLKFFLSGR